MSSSGMISADDWNDADKVDTLFLAERLSQGRLAIMLGAGASFGYGLPSWEKLIHNAYDLCKRPYPTGSTPNDASEHLLATQCLGEEKCLAPLIQQALYKDFKSDPVLQPTPLLTAIGALVMASGKGHVSRIVSFNYDDLLESYLEDHGFLIQAVIEAPSWNSLADVRIFHPHGFLPHGPHRSTSDTIVLTQYSFDKITGKSDNPWRRALLEICQEHTVLFIGLSGNDQNLLSILSDVKDQHPAFPGDHCWGVRLTTSSDPTERSKWELRGISNQVLSHYDELPPRLLKIGRQAAERRRKHLMI